VGDFDERERLETYAFRGGNGVFRVEHICLEEEICQY
jgi:hypothetical protein